MRISDWRSDVCSSDLQQEDDRERSRHHDFQPFVSAGQIFELPGIGNAHTRQQVNLRSDDVLQIRKHRSEERRVGEECVGTCSSRWTPFHQKKNERLRENETRNRKQEDEQRETK